MKNGSEKYIEAVKWLGNLYDFLNENFFENTLSKPVITVSPCERNKFTGWFVYKEIWKENAEDKGEVELNISSNFLGRSTFDTAETMIHEMCHQFAYVNKIQDTSRSGVYHNKLFARIAEAHGLDIQKVPTIGYARTSLASGSISIISGFLTDYQPIYRTPLSKGARVKSSSTRKYVCPSCGQSVRATKQVNIICADCNEPMREDE